MSLKRNKRGEWVLRFWTAGRGSRLVYKKLADAPYADAVKWAAIEEGKAKARRTKADPRLTFSELAKAYLESEADRLTPRGKAHAEMVVSRHLLPFFGAKRVEEIKAHDVEVYRKARRILVGKKVRKQSDRPIAPATFNREWCVLRAILNFGERTEMIERNPIRRRAVKLMPTQTRTVFFEPDEWRTFLGAAEKDSELRRTVPFWRTLLHAAGRISEVARLRWSDVDFTRKVVRFHQSKTAKAKTLPLSTTLDEVLRGLSRFRKIQTDAPVFLYADGTPMTVPYLQVSFRRIVKLAGLSGGGVHGKLTPHTLRHTAATWARRHGVPLDRVQEILGHADGRMTLRYAHLQADDLGSALDALAAVEAGNSPAGERTVNETASGAESLSSGTLTANKS